MGHFRNNNTRTPVNHRDTDVRDKRTAGLVIAGVAIVFVVLFSTGQGRGRTRRDDGCHGTFEGRMDYLATKTPYLPEPNAITVPEGCTAKQFWLLNRHGTRYPGDDDIIDMLDVLPVLRDEIIKTAGIQGNLCGPELDALANWRPNAGLNISKESWLVEQGYRELEGLGARFAARFPELFPKRFSNDSYYFRSTGEQRTIESLKAFAVGVFGSAKGVYIPEPVEGDPLLHFYKVCDKWIEQVDDNPASYNESNRFLQSIQFQKVQQNVQQRLGLERNLTTAEILIMYKTCAFELAWATELSYSSWCAVFDETDFKVLEYQEDLEDYWQDGYAYGITYEQACKPVQDVLQRFSDAVNGTQTQPTVAYFAHSGTILKFYGRLGLFRDSTNLTSDGYDQFESNRQWRNSKIGKFASNLAFVLFHCPKDASPFQVGTFVQEKPTPIPACDNQWICPFERFAQNLGPIAGTCDLDRICRV